MNKILIVYTLIFLQLFTGKLALHGQISNDSCKSMLTNYISKLSALNDPEGRRAYRMKVRISNYPREGSGITNTVVSEIEIVNAMDRFVYESDKVTVIQDTKDLFYINPVNNYIIWNNSTLNDSTKEKNKNELVDLQYEIINNGKIISCEEKIMDGGTFLHIKMDVITTRNTNIISAEYYYSIEKDELTKVILYFLEDYMYKYQVVEYLLMDNNYKEKSQGRIKDRIIDANGNLKPAYRGYKLINNKTNEN